MFSRSLTLLACLVAFTGCESSGPPAKPEGVEVKGKALLPSGSPLSGGVLVLRPVAGLHGATAKVEKDGSFTLTDPAGTTSVVPGKYEVYVTFNDPADKALRSTVNSRYQSSEDGNSDLVVDIPTAQSDLVIKFKR